MFGHEGGRWHHFGSGQLSFLSVEFALNAIRFFAMKHTQLMQLTIAFITPRVGAFSCLVFASAQIRGRRFFHGTGGIALRFQFGFLGGEMHWSGKSH